MLLIVLAMFAGMVLPLQAGVNASLAKYLGSPGQAAFVSFLTGVTVMALFCCGSRQFFPSLKQITSVPPYCLAGGFLGGLMVMTTIVLAPRIGAVALVSSLLAGQMIGSVILDQFGWVGYPVHPLNGMRVFGMMFLVAGVYLINRF